MLTDAKITAEIRKVNRGAKASAVLSDGAPRGAGRLVLIIKPGRAEWYAQRFVNGERRKQKLGAYPAVSLAEARERFSGHRPATGRATFGELLDAYLQTLEGRPSHKQAKSVVKAAKSAIGANRLARDITPHDIAGFIKPKFKEGRRAMAAKRRMYLSSAFKWATQSANDYRTESPRDWGLNHNPVRDVPQDLQATTPGQRFLYPTELIRVLEWASAGRPGSARYAIAIMLLTGQRVSEILRLREDLYNPADRTLHWPTTKNGRPHTTPICEDAVALLDAIRPAKDGHLFPGKDGKPRLCVDSVRAAIKRSGYAGSFCARDFRRTWKTLAGMAGLDKPVRDMIQNHGQGRDVSSKHYDRYDGMPQKRAGVAQWQAWLTEQKRQADADQDADHVVQADQNANPENLC